MKTGFGSALAIASLCCSSAAFSADPMMDATQPAPIVDVKQLPAAVQATLDREGGRVTKAQQGMENGAKSYDITVSKDGKNYLLQINGDGTIVKRDAIEK